MKRAPMTKPEAVETANLAALISADARLDALREALADFVLWAEEHRANAKYTGERPCIDAHRVNRAKAALKKAGA